MGLAKVRLMVDGRMGLERRDLGTNPAKVNDRLPPTADRYWEAGWHRFYKHILVIVRVDVY